MDVNRNRDWRKCNIYLKGEDGFSEARMAISKKRLLKEHGYKKRCMWIFIKEIICLFERMNIGKWEWILLNLDVDTNKGDDNKQSVVRAFFICGC